MRFSVTVPGFPAHPMLLTGVALMAFSLPALSAPVVVIEDTVDGMANLYYSDWGHGYTSPFELVEDPPGSGIIRASDPILDWPGPYGLNAGIPARAVTLLGSAYNFSDVDYIDISASGLVRDRNITFTGPDGDPNDQDDFRELLVYSLIGIWSSAADSIVPIGTLNGGSAPAFNVGSSERLFVPQGVTAYLFLAENDGLFYDNEGAYQVRIEGNLLPPPPPPNQVPVPAAAPLLLGALCALRPRPRA
jgi:hypothetical protein